MTEDELIWDYYNGLLLGPDSDRLRKLFVRYELFKKALESPGDIVECGVFKGAGLFFWAKLLNIHAPEAQKKVIGFDTFGKPFADSLLDYEKESAKDFVDESNFEGISTNDLYEKAEKANLRERIELISGDITETAEEYTKNNTGFRISLLNLDFDTYQGTKSALEAFFPYIAPGGIVVFDEYGKRGWGESDAVDEYFSNKEENIQAINDCFQPTAYIQKN